MSVTYICSRVCAPTVVSVSRISKVGHLNNLSSLSLRNYSCHCTTTLQQPAHLAFQKPFIVLLSCLRSVLLHFPDSFRRNLQSFGDVSCDTSVIFTCQLLLDTLSPNDTLTELTMSGYFICSLCAVEIGVIDPVILTQHAYMGFSQSIANRVEH